MLYVFQNYIGLSETSFGLKEREILAFGQISDIILEGKKIDIITSTTTYYFSNFQKK